MSWSHFARALAGLVAFALAAGSVCAAPTDDSCDLPPMLDVPESVPALLDAQTWVVDSDGTARLIIQPEFRGAGALREALLDAKIPDLAVYLVSPRVQPAWSKGKPPPTVLSRLLLVGPDHSVQRGWEHLRQLDAPPRSVRICMTVAEVWGEKYAERGGSFLWDRVNAPDPTNTLFRSMRIGFEPREFVRSSLLGLRPYTGQTTTLFTEDLDDDIFGVTLLGMYRRGHASYIARPNLLLNEGETGRIEATQTVPQILVSGTSDAPIVTQSDEIVGLKMRIIATRIGTDSAEIDLDVWFRIPEALPEAVAPVGTIVLKERRVRTTVTVRDRAPILLSGIRIRRKGHLRSHPAPYFPPLDPVFASSRRGARTSEVWFVMRVMIREPAIDPESAAHHARFRKAQYLSVPHRSVPQK